MTISYQLNGRQQQELYDFYILELPEGVFVRRLFFLALQFLLLILALIVAVIFKPANAFLFVAICYGLLNVGLLLFGGAKKALVRLLMLAALPASKNSPYTISIEDGGIRYQVNGISNFYSWEFLEKPVEDNRFVVYQTNKLIAIPKGVFKSPAEERQFILVCEEKRLSAIGKPKSECK